MLKVLRVMALALPLCTGEAALCQANVQPVPTPALPPPSADPMQIDFARDPVLRLSRTQTSPDFFRATIDAAVERHPSTQEAAALTSEARYVVDEANERRKPSLDMTVTSYKVIARKFSNDPQNIIERSRPDQRTDATLSVSQTIFDFGAGADRVLAAGARLRAAAADAEANADQVALSSIAAWYDVFAYRALVGLTEDFVRNQEELRAAVEERIRQGVSAPGDTARVD
ncbi:MAG: outer membrane protein adhesin transport system, partial [Sphingomonadales bacterium]|nr:outer membrane protein adhesin transport system [Sphingomonadales bacterium]